MQDLGVLAYRLIIALMAGCLATLIAGGEARAAADEVGVGGYHDEILRAAQRNLMSVDDGAGSGGIEIAVDAGGPSKLSSNFTPRFGGYGFEGAKTGKVDLGGLLKQSFAPSRSGGQARDMSVRQTEAAVAGIDVGWAARAAVETSEVAPSGTETFMVGGELALSNVRLDAGFGHAPGLLGLDGQKVSAGVGYSLGSFDARVSYSLVEDEAAVTETSLFTLGSQLSLRPGLVVQGDLAYAEREDGVPATAGLVSLRLRF